MNAGRRKAPRVVPQALPALLSDRTALAADPAGHSPSDLLPGVLASVRNGGLLAAAAAAVCLASSLWPRAQSRLAWAALLLALGDLGLAHLHLVPQAPRDRFLSPPAIIEAARIDGVRRLYMFDYRRRRAGRAAEPWKPDESPAFLSLPRAEQVAVLGQEYPPDGSRWGVPSGFVTDVAGLEPPARLSLNLLVRFHQEDDRRFARLLRLAGVTHLATRHHLPDEGAESFALRTAVQTPHLGSIYLYRVPRPLPRAYVVEGVRLATGPAAYALLLDPSFDPEREVVLTSGQARTPVPDFSGEARLSSDRPGHLVVDARLDRPGQLVVLEGYDPGWQARVDERPVRVSAANAIFLTLPLDAGAHRIELLYRPRSVVRGLVLSGAALVAAAVVLRARRAPSYSST